MLKKTNNKNLDIEAKIFLFLLNLREEKNKKYTIGKCDERITYLFNNYDELKSYFVQNDINISDELLDLCIMKTTKKGTIISIKKLCDNIITKSLINKVNKIYSQSQVDEIHSRGMITASEKVKEWENMSVCAPNDEIGFSVYRCDYFKDCHDCLMHYASSKEEYEPSNFEITNPYETDVLNKEKLIEKLDNYVETKILELQKLIFDKRKKYLSKEEIVIFLNDLMNYGEFQIWLLKNKMNSQKLSTNDKLKKFFYENSMDKIFELYDIKQNYNDENLNNVKKRLLKKHNQKN